MFHKIIDLSNILSRQEQINPWGQFHFQNHKYSVHLPIFWKFWPFNDILTAHCICDLSRACHTIGQGHHRVIINILLSIMLHAKFCGNGPPVPEIFEHMLDVHEYNNSLSFLTHSLTHSLTRSLTHSINQSMNRN